MSRAPISLSNLPKWEFMTVFFAGEQPEKCKEQVEEKEKNRKRRENKERETTR